MTFLHLAKESFSEKPRVVKNSCRIAFLHFSNSALLVRSQIELQYSLASFRASYSLSITSMTCFGDSFAGISLVLLLTYLFVIRLLYKSFHQRHIILPYLFRRRCMGTGEMISMGIVLQEQRFKMSQVVILSE